MFKKIRRKIRKVFLLCPILLANFTDYKFNDFRDDMCKKVNLIFAKLLKKI